MGVARRKLSGSGSAQETNSPWRRLRALDGPASSADDLEIDGEEMVMVGARMYPIVPRSSSVDMMEFEQDCQKRSSDTASQAPSPSYRWCFLMTLFLIGSAELKHSLSPECNLSQKQISNEAGSICDISYA